MEEKVIGLVYRFGKNDYQISLMDFDKEEQETLMKLMEKYDDDCSCERGNSTSLTLFQANVEYWERLWAKEEEEKKRKELAQKLWSVGFEKTDALYDWQADEQLTAEQIADALKNPRDAAYTLEAFLQFCDGSQEEEDHQMFYEAAMEIVHYMEDYQKGEN